MASSASENVRAVDAYGESTAYLYLYGQIRLVEKVDAAEKRHGIGRTRPGNLTDNINFNQPAGHPRADTHSFGRMRILTHETHLRQYCTYTVVSYFLFSYNRPTVNVWLVDNS